MITWAPIIPLIGGFPLGAEMAIGRKADAILSYTPFASNDSHFKKYWGDVPYVNLDESKYKGPQLDIAVSTCPCSALSSLNVNSSADYESVKWMYESTEYALKELGVKVLIGENAPGLYTPKGQKVVDELLTIGRRNDYSLSLMKTNTIHHGIPQKRERTFYFFWKGNRAPIMNFYNRNHKTLAEYLAEVSDDAKYTNLFNQKDILSDNPLFMFLKDRFGKEWRKVFLASGKQSIMKFALSEGFENELKEYVEKHCRKSSCRIDSIIEKVQSGGNFWDSTPNIFDDKINAVQGRLFQSAIHPTKERWINVREFMHLMGLPEDFELTDIKHTHHITQNVPTCTARDMTLEAVKFVRGELKLTDGDFVKQNNISQTVDYKEESVSLANFFD